MSADRDRARVRGRRDEAARWADSVWGTREGFFYFAFCVGGHFNERGKYGHEHFHERHGRWPDDRELFLTDAIEHAERGEDVYVAPYLRSNPSRKKGNALPSDLLYADLDQLTASLNGFERLLIGPGGLLVNSGQGRHVYLRLPADLDPDKLERLNRHLAHCLKADHGWAENKLLRLPGTWNHKGRALGGDPWPVTFLDGYRAERDWTPEQLAELLGAELPYSVPSDEPDIEPVVPLHVPAHLRERLGEAPDSDRSGQAWAFICSCLEAGLTDGETLHLAQRHPPTLEKYGGREDGEIERVIRKWREEATTIRLTEDGNAEPFRFEPVNWAEVIANGIPALDYLAPPHLPARKRIWARGPTESGKSIWAAYMAARLTRSGLLVVYVSQENGVEEDARRFLRLRPDFALLRLYADQGLDLNLTDHRDVLLAVSEDAALVILDTFSACWNGDENSNEAISKFDQEVMKPIKTSGSSLLILDHTGHPQQFGRPHARGASTKEQRADFTLEFKTVGEDAFQVTRDKKRGTHGNEARRYTVIDGPDGTLDLIETDVTGDEKAAALAVNLADNLVEIICVRHPITTSQLRTAAGELKAGAATITAAINLLKEEVPPRVVCTEEVIETAGGKQQAKVWRPAEEAPESVERLW